LTGGDDLASEWAGIKTVCFVEKDKYCQQVLRKHWQKIPIIEDVKDVTKEKVMAYCDSQREQQPQRGVENIGGRVIDRSKTLPDSKSQQGRGLQFPGVSPDTGTGGESGITIDIISGGFPCQPHSVAGKRKGPADERNLWPEFRRIIGEIKPRWVVAENVSGLFSSDAGRFFGTVLADLAALGYLVGWCTFGAVDVGAWHRRDRVFIVAHAAECIGQSSSAQPNQRDIEGCCEEVPHSIGKGLEERREQELLGQCSPIERNGETNPDSNITSPSRQREYSGQRLSLSESRQFGKTNSDWWAVEPNVGRVAYGIPHRVDRLKGLGNAVVPQQIYPLYKSIVEIETNNHPPKQAGIFE